jgi:hypothetical protein
MKGFNDLKEILKDDRLYLYLGIIRRLHLAQDRSYLKVEVETIPDQRKIISTMTWENVGPGSGEFEFPSVGDLCLVCNVEGDDDQSYVIRRMTSRADKIPNTAITGNKVHKALAGKKFWITSDSRLNLSRGDSEPTENLVLGQVFKAFASSLLASLATFAQNAADHVHIDSLGYLTTKPTIESEFLARKGEYDTLKASPIDNEAILSDLSFTEK